MRYYNLRNLYIFFNFEQVIHAHECKDSLEILNQSEDSM